jgi:hypothetical protein
LNVTTFSFMKIQRIDEKLEWLLKIEYKFDTSCSHHAYKMANFLLWGAHYLWKAQKTISKWCKLTFVMSISFWKWIHWKKSTNFNVLVINVNHSLKITHVLSLSHMIF